MALGPVNDSGLLDLLNDMELGANFGGMKAHLFVNNHVPVDADASPAVYTEASFLGYAAITLHGWSAPAVAAHVANVQAAALIWTNTGAAQNVYGIYITDATGAKLYGAVLDPAAPVALNNGDSYTVTLQVTMQPLV